MEKQYTLEITRNASFMQEFVYAKMVNNQELRVNLEGFDIVWEVLENKTDEALLFTRRMFQMTDSNLKNGYIKITMNSTQTGRIDETVTSAYWTLIANNITTEERYKLAEGRIRIRDWSPLVAIPEEEEVPQ